MPTPTKGPRLGGSPAHEKMILANLASQLFEHGRITTTETKAKRVRPLAEKMITFAKKGDLASRRRVMTVIRSKGTRITKIGPRKGDNAPMAIIEVLVEGTPGKKAVVGEATATAAKAAAKKAPAKKAAAKKADDAAPAKKAAAKKAPAKKAAAKSK